MCKDERWQVVITTRIGDMATRMKIPIIKVVFSGFIMRIIDIGILIIPTVIWMNARTFHTAPAISSDLFKWLQEKRFCLEVMDWLMTMLLVMRTVANRS